jgi:hypothetical protein
MGSMSHGLLNKGYFMRNMNDKEIMELTIKDFRELTPHETRQFSPYVSNDWLDLRKSG